MTDWLAGRGIEDPPALTPERLQTETRSLAYHRCGGGEEATTVSPTPCSAPSSQPRPAGQRPASGCGRWRPPRSAGAAAARVAGPDRAPETLAAASTTSPDDPARHVARGEAVRPLLDEGLALLRRLVEQQERGGRVFYQVPERARIELDYYRNGILAILAPECIVATVVHTAAGTLTRDRLAHQVRRLSYWFRLEFIYRTDVTFSESFAETFARMEEEGLLADEGEAGVTARAPRMIAFLAGMMRHLVEGYWVAADALRGLEREPMEHKAWLAHAREHAERLFLEGDITRAEAASTAILQNAMELFRDEHLVEKAERGGGRKPTAVYALSATASAEAVAFRRDDLGDFLVRRAVPILAAPQPPAGPTTET
ncbi:MAG: hypothetical protein R3F43_12905 [bacterium]